MDTTLGPAAWAQVAPRGRQFWLFVLVLAFGLAGFSWLWRSVMLPGQALTWQPYSNFAARQAVGLKRPFLVWYHPPATNESTAASHPALSAAVAELDTESLRVALRLKSAVLLRLDESLPPTEQKWLFADQAPSEPRLLLWDPLADRRRLLAADEVTPEAILAWLNQIGKRPDQGEQPDP